MQTNDTRIRLKNLNKNNYSFSIATLTSHAIASIANSLFTIARLIIPTNKKQLNNKEPRLEPVCWQCGTERGLITLRMSSGSLFVCRNCSGEK